MTKFNLRKKFSATDTVIIDKSIYQNRKEMNLSNDYQGVVNKNINLSLPIKNKDNTVPFNQQLEASRQNKTDITITEAFMNDNIVNFKDTNKKQIMDINIETRGYIDEISDAYKKAENSTKADTEFWDKYVGVQIEGTMKNVSDNIPSSNSQLQNHPDRFNGEKMNKMVMASIKDADAMCFHIYATAFKESRSLTDEEQQKLVDIESGKIRLAKIVNPIRGSFGYREGDPVIKQEYGKAGVYEADGTKIDEFKSCSEAKSHYPEGDIENE